MKLMGMDIFLKNMKWLGNCFEDNFLNMAWELWLASANRKGYKLVPVEATQKMVDEFPEVHYQDTYAGDCSLWVDDEIIKLGYKAMIGAEE